MCQAIGSICINSDSPVKVKSAPLLKFQWLRYIFPILGANIDAASSFFPLEIWQAQQLCLCCHSPLGFYDSVHMAHVKASLRSPYAFGGQHGGWRSGKTLVFPRWVQIWPWNYCPPAGKCGARVLKWSVLYLNPKIEQIHTHTHTYIRADTHAPLPQLQGGVL